MKRITISITAFPVAHLILPAVRIEYVLDRDLPQIKQETASGPEANIAV